MKALSDIKLSPLQAAVANVREGVFSVDDEGRVWKCGRRVRGRVEAVEPYRAERVHHSRPGYLGLILHFALRNGHYDVPASRLVYNERVRVLDETLDVYHMDGNARNNRPDNLVAMPREEVLAMHLRLGRFDNALVAATGSGEFNGCAKLTSGEAWFIKHVYASKSGRAGKGMRQIAEEFRVSVTSIKNVISGRTWAAGVGAPGVGRRCFSERAS